MFKNVLEKVGRKVSKIANNSVHTVKKYSPEICMTAGVGMLLASTVSACKGTLKLNDILDKCRDDQLVLKEGFKAHNITEDEYRSGIILTWKETILSIGKIYWKSLALAVAGILFIKHGHSILMNRLNTITTLYMSAKSLIEKYESDKETANSPCNPQFEQEVMKGEDKDGNECTVLINVPSGSDHALILNEDTCDPWFWNLGRLGMLQTIRRVEAEMTRRLRNGETICLNQLARKIGLAGATEGLDVGQIIGWTPGMGDDIVDLGLWDDRNESIKAFQTRECNELYLVPNVTGVVYYGLGDKKSKPW